MVTISFLRDGSVGSHVNDSCEDGLGFPPMGETGEGFCVTFISPSP